jgi:formiminotetrahydrofolate cyclodeaminase
MYVNKSIKIYVDDLAARKPAPGGGSAAALTAALGVSLISMVINFTLGKPRYAKYDKELKGLLAKSEKLRAEFSRLVDLDVTAYKSKNLKAALDVPLTVARLCFEGIKLCPILINKGNINLISDVAVAAVLLEAGFCGAYFNVKINLRSLGDLRVAKPITRELKRKRNLINSVRQKTEEKVGAIIRG